MNRESIELEGRKLILFLVRDTKACSKKGTAPS